MRFEEFSTQLQACVDTFASFDRTIHYQDISDELCPRIQWQKLTSYVNALKIASQQNPTDYKLVLQNIANEVLSLVKTSNFKRSISDPNNIQEYTDKGLCPSEVVLTLDSKLFMGEYPHWVSTSVRNYHKQMYKAQE